MKFFLSIFLLALAGLAFFYVGMPIINGAGPDFSQKYFLAGYDVKRDSGQGQGIKDLLAKKKSLVAGLETTRELNEIKEKLQARINTISRDQQARLDRFLPDSIDNVQLVLDVNSIARQSGMRIKGIKIDSAKTEDKNAPTPVAGQNVSNEPQVSTLNMSFSVEGSYESFLGFLDNLSKSLRLIDVKTIRFQAPTDGKNFYKYDVSIQTYWLK
ncbi:MAG: hypothetical protein UV64_C0006G0002 [Parcubacteria group bacterium GW2011_GWC1_43_11b]|uniref:Pilus assembly protein PilO n=2 Tax=Candidatus Vogeliibacteriota TaxID=1817922 RepID=A0A1G2QE85_9BACT|nr:MAG: hypothetical protein UV50_C0004G0014 [Parcubacteria group bacterium GW2011_GWB1_42_9]KKS89422.1 MAG: hypothetical protein UV64_C0006G0002 [Parcubacteria group bacterium GW2011_GWC1_43_11b]KKT10009.1 MAG: hypothetical protein UV88_C0003G0011 [Parcubacteria group bacterium GW2011_GWA1_43_21]OHA58369.1 MAG: hypothetical protein A2370_01490 [Candidatus Vogelbacteria bacterium RIFOXYB1_FULL_42_16]OHA60574.1 MAG: hypothetical protein A2607_00820 [Candidatus Vogelbacteria bacterium RIFOXYD1_FU